MNNLDAYRAQITEAHILRDCLDLLLSLDLLVIRVNQGGATQEATETSARRFVRFATWEAPGVPPRSAGISDILAIQPDTGRLWAVECKKPGQLKNVSLDQRKFLRAAEAAGAVALVVDDVDRLRAEIDARRPG